MTKQDEESLDKWCYDHDLTYFVDSEENHCLYDIDWIVRLKTEEELIKYIEEFENEVPHKESTI